MRQVERNQRQGTRHHLRIYIKSLKPYIARPLCVQPAYQVVLYNIKQPVGGLRWRSASVFDLQDVVSFQLQIGEQLNTLQYTDGVIRVLLSIDSTPIWRASATRADIFVDCFGSNGEYQRSLEYVSKDSAIVGKGTNWATWWAMDGGDDRLPLHTLDRLAQLSAQVDVVQRNMFHMHKSGQTSRLCCYLTGDGKGMQVMNYREGCRCWVCVHPYDSLEHLVVNNELPGYVRAGAFLGPIPVERRVGDYAHCACRVANALLYRCRIQIRHLGSKRIGVYAKQLGRPCHQDLRDYIQRVEQISQNKIVLVCSPKIYALL